RNDGNVDVEFVPALGGVAFVGYAVAVEPDGRILMGGGMRPGLFESFVRLKPDGTLANKFSPGSADNVLGLASDASGRVVAVGEFTSFAGQSRNHIARFNPDGTLDSTFDVGIGFDQVTWAVGLRGAGRLIVGGW